MSDVAEPMRKSLAKRGGREQVRLGGRGLNSDDIKRQAATSVRYQRHTDHTHAQVATQQVSGATAAASAAAGLSKSIHRGPTNRRQGGRAADRRTVGRHG